MTLTDEAGKRNGDEIIDIYHTGVWPQDFLKVTMIALKKKPQAKKYSDHGTISLLSHVGKILTRILNRRLEYRGVLQGCCLSPTLFIIYGEHLAKEDLEELEDFKIGGRVINDMKYADDFVILAGEPTFLQKMMNRVVETGKKYGMEINLEKSKVMRFSSTEAPINITVQNVEMEQVDGFKYLGSGIEKEGRCEGLQWPGWPLK